MPTTPPPTIPDASAAPSGVTATGRPWQRVLAHAALIGLAVSMLIHVSGLVAAGYVLFSKDLDGTATDPGLPIEFAVMTETELAALEQTPLAPVETVIPEAPVEALDLPELMDAPSLEDLGVLEEPLMDLGPSVGGGDIGEGLGTGSGGAGGGGASFFGVEAQGHRFAYIVDISGSMATGQKMPITKAELIRSLENLLETAEFSVVLYSDGAVPLGGTTGWRDATDRIKRRVRQQIMDVVPRGSTRPLPAFELVFQSRPRPDAIYFMTDGEFPEDIAINIITLNAEYLIPIHCITFVNQQAAPIMQMIAQQSGGTYTHVPGPSP